MPKFEVLFYQTTNGKQPAKEIEKAKRYRKDYIQRKGEMQ